MKSEFGTINWADFGKGLLVAVLTAFLGGILLPLTTPPMHFPTPAEWNAIEVLSGAAAAGYLLKQLGTNSDGKLGKAERK